MYALAASLTIASIFFALRGDVGFSLQDEGHLWYGALRTSEGEVPIRDFRSYDPGRYYWASAFFGVCGNGLLQLRASAWLFFAVGLSLLLTRFSELQAGKLSVLLLGALIAAISWPSYKFFEIGLVMSAIASVSWLLQRPTNQHFFYSGILVGCSAIFARNFGVYFLATIAASTAFLYAKKDLPAFWGATLSCASGVCVGYLPLLLMLLIVPGFGASFVDSIAVMFSPYTTIIPLPISWDASKLLSSMYIAIPALYSLIILKCLCSRELTPSLATILACAFVGFPVFHHVISRADLSHLAEGVTPFVVALLVLSMATPNRKKSTVAAVVSVLGVCLVASTAGRRPLYEVADKVKTTLGQDAELQSAEIRGQYFWLAASKAQYLRHAQAILQPYLNRGDQVWVTPLEPGIYPLLDARSPVWDPYAYAPVSPEQEMHIIERLRHQGVTAALVDDVPLDGLNARRFSVSHPLIWQYLNENYSAVRDERLRPTQILFVLGDSG